MKKIFNNSKRGIAVILTLCILISIAGTCVHATVVDETTQVTDEPTQELMPMMASGCTGSYVPSSWTVDTSYQGYSIEYVCSLNGWVVRGQNILQNGQTIGRYDVGHYMDGQYTAAHFHIYSDIDNGYGNVHYIL